MITLIIASATLIVASVIGGKTEGKTDAIKGTDPEHWKDWLLRFIIALPSVWLTIDYGFYRGLPQSDNWFYSPMCKSLIAGIFLMVGMGMLYGFFLNTSYNKNKGKDPEFVGMPFKTTATTDKLAHKFGVAKYLTEMMFWGGAVFCFFYFAWTIHNILNQTV
jgi:hypothetical protein